MPEALATIPWNAPHSVVGPWRQKTATLDLVIYWRSIAKRKWLILGIATAIALATWFVVSMQTPIYRSTVTLLIEQNRAKVAPTEEVYASVGDSREHFQTQTEILKARALAVKVAEKLDLAKFPDLDPRQKELPWFDKVKMQLGLDVRKRVWTEEELRNATTRAVMRGMSV